MRRMMCAIAMLFAFGAAADTTLRVVPVSGNPAPFRCGDRCKFRADVPQGPLRLRVFRGTIAQLAATGRNVPGCVEYLSTIIRARNPRRPQNVLDLRFYFRTNWLDRNRDGHFVFIVEHDDNPNGPQVEERAPALRLPANSVAKYFRSGLDVIIRAPVYGAPRMTAARTGGETARMAMAMPDDEAAGGAAEPIARDGAPTDMAPPRTAASNDCIDLQFESGEPIVIRRAERRRLPDDPLKLADQRR